MKTIKKIILPTTNQIILLNKLAIKKSPIKEKYSIINKGAIEFLVDRISNMNNIWDIATKLLADLIDFHPFIEGNKRTALLCAQTFLMQNGHNFIIEKEEIKFIYQIAKNDNKPTFSEIRSWIKSHSDKIWKKSF